jgi:hypothetical protein
MSRADLLARFQNFCMAVGSGQTPAQPSILPPQKMVHMYGTADVESGNKITRKSSGANAKYLVLILATLVIAASVFVILNSGNAVRMYCLFFPMQ